MRLGRGSSRSLFLLVLLSLVAALLVPASAANAATFPSLTLVTPVAGATVSGLTSVKVHALTDPSGTDLVGDLTLYVDGKVGGGVNNCFPRVADCTLYFLFDWSGYTGDHTEQIKETTQNGVAVSSQLVTVHAVSPPPAASIVTPSNGATVTQGLVPVQTLGVIDPSQDEDFPASMALVVDGGSPQVSFCGGGFGSTCNVSFDWDAGSAPVGAHTLQVSFTTSLGKTALSSVVHVTVVAPPVLAAPTVRINSPVDGTTVTGLNGAVVTATTDPEGDDFPASTRLYLDGALASTASCNGATSTCTLNHLYDVSGLTGTHTLRAAMTTEGGVTVSSQPVTITVVSPPPTLAIISPVANATVGGPTVEVDATGTIDPSQASDFPRTMTLLVDGTTAASSSCSVATPAACSAALDWSTATAAPGMHTLQVVLTTTHGNTGLSPYVAVTLGVVQHQPQPALVALAPSPTYRRGATGRLTGDVTLASNRSALAAAPVAVTFASPSGAAVTVTATTDVNGAFIAVDPDTLAGNTVALAALGADYGLASATRLLPVQVPIRCSVPAKATHGKAVVVTCQTAGLASGSVVTLHDAGRSVRGAVHGKVKSGQVTFSLTIAKQRQWVTVWATIATSHTFTASRSRNYALHVR